MSATDATFSPRLPWRNLCVRCALCVFLSAGEARMQEADPCGDDNKKSNYSTVTLFARFLG